MFLTNLGVIIALSGSLAVLGVVAVLRTLTRKTQLPQNPEPRVEYFRLPSRAGKVQQYAYSGEIDKVS
jgi:hypothetical protein